MKIVSLLPAATEIVCALGLEEHLVGVTHECDHPPSVRDLPRVTRTLISAAATSGEIDSLIRERVKSHSALYALDVAALERVAPDLILTQALCDVCAVAEDEVRAAAGALPGTPLVVAMNPGTIGEVFESVRQVARVAAVEERGERLVRELTQRVDAVARLSQLVHRRARVAFLEWLDPPFSSGHWTPELVRLAGGIDVLGREGAPSRTLKWEEVVACEPDVVVVACCGFSVERTLGEIHVLENVRGWDDLAAVRAGRVYVLDGSQFFSRPGPRLVDGLELLAHVLHPDINPMPNYASARLHRLAPDLQPDDSVSTDTMLISARKEVS